MRGKHNGYIQRPPCTKLFYCYLNSKCGMLTKKKKKLFANYAFPLYGLTWSMEHQSGTHAHFKKELESTQKFACKVITRNWDKGYDELLDTTNLQIESCTSNCAPYTKLCTISLIFLVYLKSLRVAEIWNMCS